MKANLMIDLETLGTSARAVVTEMAAVLFDPTTGEILDRWSCCPSWESQKGRATDAATLQWWFNRGDPAVGDTDVHQAMVELTDFFVKSTPPDAKGHLVMWSKSPTFDLAILRNLYEWTGMECPWSYLHERDVRTVFALAKEHGWEPEFALSATVHRALDDAERQSIDLSSALRWMFPSPAPSLSLPTLEPMPVAP